MPHIPQARMYRLAIMIKKIRERPHTVHELKSLLETHERTIYRYLDLLKEIGLCIDCKPVKKDNDHHLTYFIFGSCPFCGQNC